MKPYVENALVTVAQSWPAFKIDPAWCMQYLDAAVQFLTEHRTFITSDLLTYAIARGVHRPETLRPDVWCDGHDMLIRLGWIAPLPFAADGSRDWMSLL